MLRCVADVRFRVCFFLGPYDRQGRCISWWGRLACAHWCKSRTFAGSSVWHHGDNHRANPEKVQQEKKREGSSARSGPREPEEGIHLGSHRPPPLPPKKCKTRTNLTRTFLPKRTVHTRPDLSMAPISALLALVLAPGLAPIPALWAPGLDPVLKVSIPPFYRLWVFTFFPKALLPCLWKIWYCALSRISSYFWQQTFTTLTFSIATFIQTQNGNSLQSSTQDKVKCCINLFKRLSAAFIHPEKRHSLQPSSPSLHACLSK